VRNALSDTGEVTDVQRAILCDPQTSGGLLIAVDPQHAEEFQLLAGEHGLEGLFSIGRMTEDRKDSVVTLI
jgi:selenide, water dikinase